MALTPRQARFVEEYLVDLNGTQAAQRAGYSAKTANEQAARLLANASVRAAVDEAKAARSERTQITADRVLAEIACLGFANMLDYSRLQGGDLVLDFSAITREQAAAIQELTVDEYKDGSGEGARDVKRVRFKLADKRAALVDLGKHLGLFSTTRVELTGKDGGPIETHELVGKLASMPQEKRDAIRAAIKGVLEQ